jgi:NAD-dependent histone deacetylase SIR2
LNFPTPTNTWSGVFDAWIQGDAQAFAAMLCDEMLKELQADGAQGMKQKQQVDNAESTNRKRRRNTKLSSTPKILFFINIY